MTYGAASATDTGDDSVAITYSAASGSTFAIGTTAGTATATEHSEIIWVSPAKLEGLALAQADGPFVRWLAAGSASGTLEFP